MADRVVFRLWTITDYEKEEQFLKDQHRKGWKFTRYLIPGFYLFDRCEPGEVVYRVDFDNAAERERRANICRCTEIMDGNMCLRQIVSAFSESLQTVRRRKKTRFSVTMNQNLR